MAAAVRCTVVLTLSVCIFGCQGVQKPTFLHHELQEGWAIRSAAEVEQPGELISIPGFSTKEWHPATVPTTVVAALVADGTYPDPHVGMNLREIPGCEYEIATNFSNVEMPEDSPFRAPWWYRTEFALPNTVNGRTIWLRLGGINFTANIWLNGSLLAKADEIAGTWRVHELDITGVAKAGQANALAVEVVAPTPDDLALTFVDWNPMPPDKVMGLFRPVSISTSGPVRLRHPQVVSELDLPSLASAELTVKVFAHNARPRAVFGTLRARIGELHIEEEISLDPGEQREIVMTPQDHPELVLEDPELWWPAQYGEPRLHDLELEIEVDGAISDQLSSRFGIRQFDAAIDDNGHLLYRVNGKPILIRGAGWTPEMLLRSSPERLEQELRLVADMGLNTVRLEGKLEREEFFDLTDSLGLLVMPGWCCCHLWERWDEWGDDDLPIAVAQLRDQMLRLRGRASVFTWLNGSDYPPPAAVEQAYLAVESELGFPNPVVSSATERVAEYSGPSGVKMRGPYEWVPPIYWYTDTTRGGPHGFATEIGPGPAPPPLESLRRFLPEDELWPIGETWSYHCGGGPFRNLDVFNLAMASRYGEATSLEEYARTAQVAAYESHRAMFESFSERKYVATGVIQWMLNNAWPGMIWHLYDFYLRPGGSYFGVKKACEPLHIQYAYDDCSVVVVNSTLEAAPNLTARARVFDLAANQQYANTQNLDAVPDSSIKLFQLPEPTAALSPTYFLVLELTDQAGARVSSNVYWLSTTAETLDWKATRWYFTPVEQYADLSGLDRLAPAEITTTLEHTVQGSTGMATVHLSNPSSSIAFFLHLALRKGQEGEEVLPILWEDNYVTLLPGESRVLTASYALSDLGSAQPVVTVDGWNLAE